MVQKIYSKIRRKLGIKSHNLLCCSFLQAVAYNLQFHWNRKYIFSAILKLHDRLFVASWLVFHLFDRKGNDWFLPEGFLLDWQTFHLYLLQSVFFSKYSAKKTNIFFLNQFLYFIHPFILKHFKNFVTVMRSNFTIF